MYLTILRNIPGFRLQFVLVIILSIIQSMLNAISVTALIPLGGAVVGGEAEPMQWPLSELSNLAELGLSTMFMILAGTLLLKVAVALLSSVMTNRLKQNIWKQWAHQLLRWQLHMPYRDLVNQDSGELINLSTRELIQATSFLAGYISLLTQIFSFTLLALAVLLVDIRLLFAGAALGLFSYFTVLRPMNRLAQRLGTQGVTLGRDFATLMSETIGGVRDLRLMNAEERRLTTVDRSVERMTRNDFFGSILQDIPANAVEIILGLLLLALGIYLSTYGRASEFLQQTPVILFVLVSIFRLTSSAAQLSALHVKNAKRLPSFNAVVVAAAKANQYAPMKDKHPEQKSLPRRLQAQEGFELRGLSFLHGERQVLGDINLTLPLGKVTYLRGPSGSGKSSIADVLARLYEPEPGTIFVDGKDAINVPIEGWRSLVGYASQDPVLFSGKLDDNMRLGAPDATSDEIEAALKAAGVDEAYFGPERGLDMILAERGRNLSGGQKCRIAIARALLSSPSLLILDESTGGIDIVMEAEIVNQLKRIKNISVLVISHRQPLEGVADQLVALNQGQLTVEIPLSQERQGTA